MKSLQEIARQIVPVGVRFRGHILAARLRQCKIRARIRSKACSGGKINVIFIVSEVAKWKCQSLYDLMKSDCRYNPIIGLLRQDATRQSSNSEVIENGLRRAEEYFSKFGCQTFRISSDIDDNGVPIEMIAADIVFYQQPWNIDDIVNPRKLSKVALLCYVPYFVLNYYADSLGYNQLLHHYLAYHFILNQNEEIHAQGIRRIGSYAGRLQIVGHPMLDDFYLNPIEDPKKPCVIYAPHFTFSHPNNPVLVHYSTFLKTGEYLLQYARKHPEMNWVFKPHPVLKTALKNSGAWSVDKIEEYYSEWAKFGRVCETGDYLPLFRAATAMITDCGSFLSEFGSTKKPIIHLINAENNLEMPDLYDTYYKVHNLDELTYTLHEVLEKGNDYKRDTRIKAVVKANLSGQYAAKNIMDFFDKEFKVKR